MKKSALIVTIASVLFVSSLVSAEDAHHPEQTQPGKAPQATSSSDPSKDMSAQQQSMKENMQKMQAEMEKIHQTTDTAERQKLMQEHMQSMREQITMMRSMGGGMMSDDPKTSQKMVAECTDIMQMMIEQMMQHQEAMQPMPK
jgi:hypothetical protein